MLTLIIKADGDGKNILEKEQNFLEITKAYEKAVNVIFLAHSNYLGLSKLKEIATQNDNHELFVCDNKTSDEEMITMAFFMTKNDDVLLCDLLTTEEVFKELLYRRSQGYKVVRVRKKTNFFSQSLRVLGNWSYNIGLKMQKKCTDNFAEAEVMYLDSNIVDSLRNNVTQSKETRILNTYPETKHMTVESKKIFDSEQKVGKNEKTMLKYGTWSLVFILVFIALTSVYPFFYNFTYSWWMIVIIVLWVGLGLLLTFVYSKKVLYKRTTPKNRVNQFGEPLFGYDYYYTFGDEVEIKKPLPKLEKPIIKNKNKKVRR